MTLGISRRASILVLAGILLVGNLGFFLWYRATAQQRKNETELRRVQLVRDVEARELEAANLSRQRERLSEVSSAVDDFYGKRIGPSRDTLAPVVLEVHKLLQNANIAPTQISYATKPMQELPLSEMRIAFGFRNDYLRLKQLLAAIEADKRWIVVREVGLNRDPEIPGSVQARMVLATYFAKEEPVPAPRSARSVGPAGRAASTASAASAAPSAGPRR